MNVTRNSFLFKVAKSIERTRLIPKLNRFEYESNYPQDLCSFVNGFLITVFVLVPLSILLGSIIAILLASGTATGLALLTGTLQFLDADIIEIGKAFWICIAVFGLLILGLLIVGGVIGIGKFVEKISQDSLLGTVKEYLKSRKEKYCVRLDYQ